ncbi:MAG TPA: PilZ domain-containing protein [Terriglobales bacterium]|nr:PilZ domain-containing protein [Terriglobales bacterium]
MADLNNMAAQQEHGEGHEARRFQRFRVDIRLRIITGPANSNRTVFARGSNISEGGLRAFVPADLVLGDMVTLELILPYSDKKISVRGMLRNRDGFSYGVEYAASTTQEEREHIARVCNTLALIQ